MIAGEMQNLASLKVKTDSLRVAVVVASINRAEEIGQLLHQLSCQTLAPSAIILSVTKPGDLPEVNDPRVTVIFGEPGLTRQRNRGLDAAMGHADVVVFYDDDFLPAPTALQGISDLFMSDQRIAGATGLVLRDGIKCGGLDYALSIDCLNIFSKTMHSLRLETVDFDELYGCNMAVRMTALSKVRFDEKLPLYAWQEDVDFAGQLLRQGRVVRTNSFAGVHRGVVKGRSPGVPLGVSQILNPLYMVRKRTMRPMKAAELIARNVLANHARALRPESYVDRLGRVRGNWLGVWFCLTGRTDPELIVRLT
jgi:GT2 family glycosyltransferase